MSKTLKPAPAAPTNHQFLILDLEDRVLDIERKLSLAMVAIEGIRDSESAVDEAACDGLWWLLSDVRQSVGGILAADGRLAPELETAGAR